MSQWETEYEKTTRLSHRHVQVPEITPIEGVVSGLSAEMASVTTPRLHLQSTCSTHTMETGQEIHISSSIQQEVLLLQQIKAFTEHGSHSLTNKTTIILPVPALSQPPQLPCRYPS